MVRAFTHGAMGRQIDPSWWTHQAISRSSQCSTTGSTKAVVCGMVHIKEPLLLIGKSSPCGGSRFPLSLFEWSFIINLKPYNHKYNVLSVSLNKHFLPSCSFSHYQNKSCDQINPCFHPNMFIVLFWPWTIATNITLTTAVFFFAGFLSCSLPYTGCYKIFPSFFSCL